MTDTIRLTSTPTTTYTNTDSIAFILTLTLQLCLDVVDYFNGLVAFLAETYDFQIPPEDVTIERFRSIQTITEYVADRVGENV